MAVSDSVGISRAGWGGYNDPSLPIGVWFGRVSVVGNGTGGLSTLSLEFQPAGASTLDSNLYSLEQIAGFANAAFTIAAINLGINPTLSVMGDTGQEWSVTVGGPLTADSVGFNQLLPKGLFLGAQVALGYKSGLDIVATNTNAVTHRFTAMGYLWSSRSRSVQGGPQRPPSGLF